MQENIYESAEYRRARGAYCAQCGLEYFSELMVCDVFLARLLTSLGLSDSLTGVVTSLISVACLTELVAFSLMRRVKSIKRSVMLSNFVSMLFFALAYCLPLVNLPQAVKTAGSFIFVGGGFMIKYATFSMYLIWANSYVDPGKLGRYNAVKEMISLIGGALFSLAMGFVFDRFKAAGKMNSCFALVSAVIIALDAACVVCIWLIGKGPGSIPARNRPPMGETLRALFSCRPYRRVLIITTLWKTSIYLSTGFMGTFKTNDLLFSVGAISIINVSGQLFRFALSIPFGRYSDKTSYAAGFSLALYIAAAAFACGALTTPATRLLIIAYTLLINLHYAGTNANSFNLVYCCAEEKYRTQALAFKNAFTGIVAFCASLIGGKVVSVMQAKGTVLYPQQLLCAVSCALALLTAAYSRRYKFTNNYGK